MAKKSVAKKAAKKPVAKKAVPTKSAPKKSAPKPAARKTRSKVNKSQRIREYAAKNPKAGPTEITRALAKDGIKVTPPLVSNVLGAAKRKKVGKRKAVSAKAASDKVSLSDLVATGQFVDKVGGVDEAKALIKAIEKLG